MLRISDCFHSLGRTHSSRARPSCMSVSTSVEGAGGDATDKGPLSRSTIISCANCHDSRVLWFAMRAVLATGSDCGSAVVAYPTNR